MNNNLRYIKCVVLLVIFSFRAVLAQTPKRMEPASADEILKAQTLLEGDLNNFKAHTTYIFAMGMNNPLLWDQYEVWMKEYPQNLNIPLAIGKVYPRAVMPQPRDFLLKAAALDPRNAEVWYMLATDADLKAQGGLLTEYMHRATLADSTNVGYAYGYLKSLEKGNQLIYEKKVLDFVKRFPEDERGAQAIFALGQQATAVEVRVHYFELLRTLYAPKKFKWSASGMVNLADAYLQTDIQKALMLINEMGEEGDWMTRRQIANALIEIEKLEQKQDYLAAGTMLNELKLPGINYIDGYITLKKSHLQEKSGNLQGAYDSLSVKFAKLPTDQIREALELYGQKLGKYEEQISKDIRKIRNERATSAYPFELPMYSSKEKLNLTALKGKAILLTFWFPGCAPCREEFPHFQTVVDSFKGDSLVYLGINILPAQDGFVLPFLKNTHYSFIPLRGNTSFAQQYFGVQGAPENFLIDKNGKIVFKDFRIDNTNRRTLELMIRSLL